MSKTAWTVVICGGAILTIGLGLRQSFGLFLVPMSADLGFSRELWSLAIGISNVIWGAASPFMGGLADRFGMIRVTVAGAVLYVAGLAVMGIATGGEAIMLANVLIGFGIAGAGFSTILGAVGRAAPPEKRSLALGIAAAAGSFGQFAVVPVSHAFLDGLGWVWAWFALTVLAVVMIPLAWGLKGGDNQGQALVKQSMREALAEASRHRSFWLLTIGFFVCGFHVVFVATHLPAFLTDRGMPTWVGAWALALIGLFNIAGSYLAGMFGGMYSKKNLLAGIYFARAFVFLIMIVLPITPTTVLVFAALLGFLWLGTVPLTSGLVATFFGPTWMATLYGIVFFSHQVGSLLGAWMGGWAFDRLGSYDIMWWLSVALGVIAALLHWPIVERPVARLTAAPARA
jgi:MFS family permease